MDGSGDRVRCSAWGGDDRVDGGRVHDWVRRRGCKCGNVGADSRVICEALVNKVVDRRTMGVVIGLLLRTTLRYRLLVLCSAEARGIVGALLR